MGTPSASRQSALPEDELTDRFPCFATLNPCPGKDKCHCRRDIEGQRAVSPVPQVSTTSKSTLT